MALSSSTHPVTHANRHHSLTPLAGLVIAGLGVGVASFASSVTGLPMTVVAVLVGMLIGSPATISEVAAPGLRIAATTVMRLGIVLLGLRLSFGQVMALGWVALAVVVITVATTFFGVQLIGARWGLSKRLSLFVASGFSICGNSAIAAVAGTLRETAVDQQSDDEQDVAAAVGLVTLCGTLAIVVVPTLGRLLGLDDLQLGVWIGASVQDTAQVIAVASAASPSVLALATAVKLTRVLLLAPIVTGVSLRANGRGNAATPQLVPLFVVGFVAALSISSVGVVPTMVLEFGGQVSTYALAAGMVGLGSTVRWSALRRLGLAPLALGAAAWVLVGGISLVAIWGLA